MHLVIDGELIETTPEHPFYTIAGEWVEAENLTIGDYGTVEGIDLIPTMLLPAATKTAQLPTTVKLSDLIPNMLWLITTGVLYITRKAISIARLPTTRLPFALTPITVSQKRICKSP